MAGRGGATLRRSAAQAVMLALQLTAIPSAKTPGARYQVLLSTQVHVHDRGAMATRCGGRAIAAAHWVIPL